MNDLKFWAKKYRVEITSFAFLTPVYFFLRLYHILLVPIFTDEAIYTRWTQIAKQDASWRFISLTDGKQPLFVWINMFFMRFVSDPLLSGRLVSTAAGFASVIGLFFLGKELFKNRWVGITAALLYIIYPFGLVYDKMALYDSLVGTFYVWSLYFGVLLVKKIRLDIALILGLTLGGGALNKSIGLYSVYLLPINILLFSFKEKKKRKLLGELIVLAVVASAIAETMYSILRLSPWFYIIKQKDTTFFYPLSDLLHRSVSFWEGNFLENFHILTGWLNSYMSWPILIAVFIVFIFYKEFLKEKLLLFLYFIIPFVGLAVLGKVLYPRYILFMTLPLLVLAAYTFLKLLKIIKNLYMFVLIIVCFLSLFLWSDYFLLKDFERAPIPKSDLDQYINDWPAGGGVREAVEFFKHEAMNKKIYVATEGTFGLMPYSFEIYLVGNHNITIHGFWPIHDNPPQETLAVAERMPVYFVFYQPCVPCRNEIETPVFWNVKIVHRYAKGIGKRYLTIYQLLP